MTIKNDLEIDSVNPLYLILGNVNGHFQEINGYKYLTIVLTNETKEKIKKYEELWIKIRDLTRSVTKSLDDYDEKYMKVKFDSDDNLPLNKIMEIPLKIIAVFMKIPNIIYNCF